MDTKRDEFWNFLIKGFEVSSTSASVTGWFIYCRRQVITDVSTGGVPTQVLSFEYLTPEAQPVTLDLKSFLNPNTKIGEITSDGIVEALEYVFGRPFKKVPKAPLNVPIHKIPPSRRKKLEEGLRKKEGTVGRTPPEDMDIGM